MYMCQPKLKFIFHCHFSVCVCVRVFVSFIAYPIKNKIAAYALHATLCHTVFQGLASSSTWFPLSNKWQVTAHFRRCHFRFRWRFNWQSSWAATSRLKELIKCRMARRFHCFRRAAVLSLWNSPFLMPKSFAFNSILQFPVGATVCRAIKASMEAAAASRFGRHS